MKKFGIITLSALGTIGIGAGAVAILNVAPATKGKLNISYGENQLVGDKQDSTDNALEMITVKYVLSNNQIATISQLKGSVPNDNIAPIKQNYKFIGWTDLEGNIITSIENDIELYPWYAYIWDNGYIFEFIDENGIKMTSSSAWNASQDYLITQTIVNELNETMTLECIGFCHNNDEYLRLIQPTEYGRYMTVYQVEDKIYSVDDIAVILRNFIFGDNAEYYQQARFNIKTLDTNITKHHLSTLYSYKWQFKQIIDDVEYNCVGFANVSNSVESVLYRELNTTDIYYPIYEFDGELYSYDEVYTLLHANDVTISFANGDEITTAVLTKGDVIQTETTPTKDGYVFAGWSTTENGTTPVITVEEDTTLYPIFIDNTKTIMTLHYTAENGGFATSQNYSLANFEYMSTRAVLTNDLGETRTLKIIGFHNYATSEYDSTFSGSDYTEVYYIPEIDTICSADSFSEIGIMNYLESFILENNDGTVEFVHPTQTYEDKVSISYLINLNFQDITISDVKYSCVGYTDNEDSIEYVEFRHIDKTKTCYPIYSDEDGNLFSYNQITGNGYTSDERMIAVILKHRFGETKAYANVSELETYNGLTQPLTFDGLKFICTGFAVDANSTEIVSIDIIKDNGIHIVYAVFKNQETATVYSHEQMYTGMLTVVTPNKTYYDLLLFEIENCGIDNANITINDVNYTFAGWSNAIDSTEILNLNDISSEMTLYTVYTNDSTQETVSLSSLGVSDVVNHTLMVFDLNGSGVETNNENEFVSLIGQTVEINGVNYAIVGFTEKTSSSEILEYNLFVEQQITEAFPVVLNIATEELMSFDDFMALANA